MCTRDGLEIRGQAVIDILRGSDKSPQLSTQTNGDNPSHLGDNQVIAEAKSTFFSGDLPALLDAEPQALDSRVELTTSVRHGSKLGAKKILQRADNFWREFRLQLATE